MLPTAPRYKYLDALTTAFVVILLVSNLVAQKVCLIGPFAVSGAVLLYLMGAITIALPAAPGWHNQQAFATVFGFIPRILAASLIAFWAGEFANSYTMARLKLITNGRKLCTRTTASTVV